MAVGREQIDPVDSHGSPGGRSARDGWLLGLADRIGSLRYTVLMTVFAIVGSVAIAGLVYIVTGFDPFAEPVAIVLPILCPLLIAPPLTLNAIRQAIAIRDQGALIEQQNAALMRALAEKDRIISLVGHDLRGNLNLIMGFAQLIERQGDTIPAERLIDYATGIHDTGRKTNHVLTDLLYWGQARAGQRPTGSQALPIGAVINNAVTSLRAEADMKQIILDAPCQSTGAEVDRVVVESAIRNLVSNAIKFSHPGGKVMIDPARSDSGLRISVTDNGIGMDQAQLAKLRAGHLPDSTEGTVREVGNGLGLAICRDLIEGYGGSVEFESTPDRGTVATIVLPDQVLSPGGPANV